MTICLCHGGICELSIRCPVNPVINTMVVCLPGSSGAAFRLVSRMENVHAPDTEPPAPVQKSVSDRGVCRFARTIRVLHGPAAQGGADLHVSTVPSVSNWRVAGTWAQGWPDLRVGADHSQRRWRAAGM